MLNLKAQAHTSMSSSISHRHALVEIWSSQNHACFSLTPSLSGTTIHPITKDRNLKFSRGLHCTRHPGRTLIWLKGYSWFTPPNILFPKCSSSQEMSMSLPSAGRPHWVTLHRCCILYGLKVRGGPASSTSAGTSFPSRLLTLCPCVTLW